VGPWLRLGLLGGFAFDEFATSEFMLGLSCKVEKIHGLSRGWRANHQPGGGTILLLVI